jgi:hypothetical protein
VTVKLTELAVDGPATFVHINVYVSVPAADGETDWVPLLANAPLQLPVAVQPVVLAEDQVRMDEPPTAMELADRDNTGAAGTTGGMSSTAASACTNPYPEL